MNDPNPSLPANTTAEEDIVTAGQRRINLIWETTQARIAIYVIVVDLIVSSSLALMVVIFKLEVSTNQLAVITLCMQPITLIAGIVIGFYFSRTNHSAIGGVGKKKTMGDEGTR